MRNLLADLKYGLRLLARSPGFTAITLLILALGIGATTAVFSVLSAVMLKPLPYPDANKIVLPWRLAPPNVNLGYKEIPWGIDDFHRMASGTQAFESIAAFKPDSFNVTGAGEPVFLEGVRASWQFFRVLGVQPALGRAFTAEEDRPERGQEVILSYSLWRERFNHDRAVLGRSVDLNGRPYTVIGVMPAGFAFPRGEEMPEGFRFPHRPQIWIPLALPAARPPNYPDELAVAARLKDGATVAQAQAQMELYKTRMESMDPSFRGWYGSRTALLTGQVTGGSRTPLILTLAAVCVVLLIACSNIASLLLARCLGRGAEFALRAALGAGRGRLVRQLLSESLLLAVFGGVAGIGIADASIQLIKALGPASVPRLQEASLDPAVLLFALASTLASGVLFGLMPALVLVKQNLSKSLRESGRNRAGSYLGSKLRNGLLVFEVALALILVVVSCLFTQTFYHLQNADIGFQAGRVLTFALSLPETVYPEESFVPFYRRLLSRLRSVPGVDFAGLVSTVPMDGATDGIAVEIPGRTAEKNGNPFTNYTIVSAGYFSAVRTPLMQGRDFQQTDSERSAPVAIVNQSLAQRFWPGISPLGKQLFPGGGGARGLTVVGVVANVKRLSHREKPPPEMFVPFMQKPFPSMRSMHLVIRGKDSPGALVGTIRSAVRSLDPDLPVIAPATLQSIVDASLVAQRFSMLLLGAFAALSLLLASFGLYGAVSYSASQRTREIGIRLALGAGRRKVAGLILSQGARLVGVGIVVGLAAATGLTRLIGAYLYGVHPTDIRTFLFVSLLLMGVTLLASYLPARRACRIDPAAALRQE